MPAPPSGPAGPRHASSNNPLCADMEAWMDQGWSPGLIADVVARDHPDDRLMRVSHETIYTCLFVQSRGTYALTCTNGCRPSAGRVNLGAARLTAASTAVARSL
jgi:IS30 family transposase